MKTMKIIIILLVLFSTSGCMSSFSNINYQKNIVSEAYLLNKEDVSRIISSNKIETINQPTYSEIHNDPYLLLRFRNTGDKRPFKGVVVCHLNSRGQFDVNIHGLGFGHELTTYTLQLTDFNLPHKGSDDFNAKPIIKISWSELYIK